MSLEKIGMFYRNFTLVIVPKLRCKLGLHNPSTVYWVSGGKFKKRSFVCNLCGYEFEHSFTDKGKSDE